MATIIRRDHRARLVIPEANGVGDPLCELLQNRLDSSVRVAPFVTTSASKRQIVDRLALSIEQRSISFPDIPRLVNELELFEFSTSAAGNLRFNAPSGAHDDAVMALALAHHAFAGIQITGPPAAGVYVSPRASRSGWQRPFYDDESIWHDVLGRRI